jgi:hypothetical protein
MGKKERFLAARKKAQGVNLDEDEEEEEEGEEDKEVGPSSDETSESAPRESAKDSAPPISDSTDADKLAPNPIETAEKNTPGSEDIAAHLPPNHSTSSETEQKVFELSASKVANETNKILSDGKESVEESNGSNATPAVPQVEENESASAAALSSQNSEKSESFDAISNENSKKPAVQELEDSGSTKLYLTGVSDGENSDQETEILLESNKKAVKSDMPTVTESDLTPIVKRIRTILASVLFFS